jgi:hypothetical protein
MKRSFVTLTCLTLVLAGVWILGSSLGLAQANQPVQDPRPSPTPNIPVPDGAVPFPEFPPMPDLVVEQIEVVPAIPRINEPATIYVTIANRGSADVGATNNFYTDLYIDPAVVPIQLGQDGEWSWGCQGWWLPAGASYTLTTTWTFGDVKIYALYAQVDTDAFVAEENENNNVSGPFQVVVEAPDKILHQTHQDFQMGMASGLDLSHPQGVIRLGIFDEPSSEPDVYAPDTMINSTTGTGPTNVSQVNPTLTGDGNGTLFAAWEDGRNGGVFNRDIYFAYSYDDGATWIESAEPITHTANQVSPDLAYDPARNRLYAVWQDGRNGNYDIYFAYSMDDGATWTESSEPLNDDWDWDIPLKAAQMNPTIVVEPTGAAPYIYVVWQDKRNGNDDVYIVRSTDGGLNWGDNFFVTDDPDMTLQNQVAPAVDVDALRNVYVCWEDWRAPLSPDIYCSRYLYYLEPVTITFGIDVPVTYPDQGTSYRIQPSMVVSMTREILEEWDPIHEITTYIPIDVTVAHVAWQEGQGDDADIYYAYSTYKWDHPDLCPYPYDFCFKDPQEVSGFVIDSDYALPPDPGPIWPIDPSWQGQVSLTRASDYDWTWCHADSEITYTMGVYVAWSDAATFDDWRYEIQTRRIASPLGEGETYETCEDQATGVVNDNAKLYAYRDDLALYELYKPAATRQSNPSIYARPPAAPTFAPSLYVSWDDDRWDEPFEPGSVRNRDVFMTRLGYDYRVGIYISQVIDSHALSTWYVLSWWGATQHVTDLLMQTRFGTTPNPPQTEYDPSSGWTRWTGNPSSNYLQCERGADCYYDAPGRHIVDEDGNDWPEYRYIQYKVIIRGTSRLTALSRVVLHYRGPYKVYLPLAMKGH